MAFGQLVVGPPGSGKTTYCMGMAQFMRSTGRKVTFVIAMDTQQLRLCSASFDQLALMWLSAILPGRHCEPRPSQ
jgi:signal recognition particle GTPase